MELIQNPEQKAMYDKCKYRVKLWEYHFRKQYGRVPSKVCSTNSNLSSTVFNLILAGYS